MCCYDDFKIVLLSEKIVEITERNLLEQYDALEGFFYEWEKSASNFILSERLICDLNEIAVKDLRKDAGRFRIYPVSIENSSHQPPEHKHVQSLIKDFCDYINNSQNRDPYHLAAYALWYINWVHPFGDGNGRTARALSYLMLCIGLGFYLPGTDIIPAQIANDKSPYYLCLDKADAAYSNGNGGVDLGDLEHLLKRLLMKQLGAP